MTTRSNNTTNNPTEIVGIDTIPPKLEELSEADLKNFTYTGINVNIKLPLVKDTDEALFAINTDGFIPGITMRQDSFKGLVPNMFPVQVFENALQSVEVTYEPIALPILHYMYSYRFLKGKPRLGLRMSSNVGQTGNIIISQASGIQRYFYNKTEEFRGLRFLNADATSSTFAPAGLTIWDVSINRNVGITPISRENMPALDIMMKMKKVIDHFSAVSQQSNELGILTSQFLEEWLLFTPQNSLPNTNGGELEIGLYMDWSEVQFDCPGIPIQPISSKFWECQILNISKSFNFKVIQDINLSTANGWKTALSWKPGQATKDIEKENSTKKING